MARPPQSDEERSAKRRQIQRAAIELYRERGSDVTVRNVADRAGVSVGTVYSYFDSLATLMRSLWTGAVARVNVEFIELASEFDEPLARIRALLERYVQFALDEPEVYRSALLYVRPPSHEQPEPDHPDELPFHALLVAAVREGQGVGTIVAGEPEGLAQVLWAGVHGAVALSQNMSIYRLEGPAELGPTAIDLLLRGIRVPPTG